MSLSLDQALAVFQPQLPLAVAYSAGADSTALLLACHRRWPGQVRAIHINHGLQAAATQFEQHAYEVTAAWGVPLKVCAVQAHPEPGQSPEDAARRARYSALCQAAKDTWAGDPSRSVALAQHADDQVETMLLALSRGAGLAGLAGMPAHWQRAELDFYRPLLQLSRPAIEEWLVQQGLRAGRDWVNDPSNGQLHYTRNRIRALITPALGAALPQFRSTFARSAAHAAQAQALMMEVAVQDLVQVGVPPAISVLQKLSTARQANVLRYWLRSAHHTTPSAAQLRELMQQIARCTTRGHRIELQVGSGRVVRRQNALHWYNQPR